MIPTSSGALMIMLANHLALFLSGSKCSINVTLAFYSFINHIALSNQTVNSFAMRVLSYLSFYSRNFFHFSSLRMALKVVLPCFHDIVSPGSPQTSHWLLLLSFLNPDL